MGNKLDQLTSKTLGRLEKGKNVRAANLPVAKLVNTVTTHFSTEPILPRRKKSTLSSKTTTAQRNVLFTELRGFDSHADTIILNVRVTSDEVCGRVDDPHVVDLGFTDRITAETDGAAPCIYLIGAGGGGVDKPITICL